MGKTILITGGAGFVGSSLAFHLKQADPGNRVVALDNLKRRGSELNLARLKAAGVEFMHGDVRQPRDLEAIQGFDTLLECSAEPSVLAGYGGDSRYVVDTNLVGTVNCLEAAARHGASIIFLSTSRVYPIETINAACIEGENGFFIDPGKRVPGISGNGFGEDLPLKGTRSLYGATKLASELLIAEYAAMHDLRSVINRCGVIAGPWQMGKTDQGFAVLWIARHHWGLPLNYTGFGGRGSQVRDMLHIDDLCELISLQLRNLDRLGGMTFNVGGGPANSLSLRGYSKLAADTTGRTITVGSAPDDRPGDLKLYITDNSLITATTGWAPKRDLRTLFADTHRWLADHEEELRPILT